MTDEIQFFRPAGHGLAHASKTPGRTLCGLRVDSTWAAVTEKDFRQERPCEECKYALGRILRRGRQLDLLSKF